MERISLYLHVPFCRHRCSYCDFNTFAGQERQIPAYVDAICSEIQQVGRSTGVELPVHTIFFGGGTPSLLSAAQIDQILRTIRDCYSVDAAAEITMEANPGTVSPEYLQAVRASGVNRLSFGMQSAHPDDLRLLERQHDFFDVQEAVLWARRAGFDNLSLDLIFALPGQSLERWKETMERAAAMSPNHLSLYALTIEKGTPLQRRWNRGMIPLVDDDLAADMYEMAMDTLPQWGYQQYEISNWARNNEQGTLMASIHNSQYWLNQPYFGFGAGAHGFLKIPERGIRCRTINVGGIRPYIERCQGTESRQQESSIPIAVPAARRIIQIDERTEMQETMMVGLRLTQQGVSAQAFQDRFGQTLESVFGDEITYLTRAGLLEWIDPEKPRLRLTRRGRMLGNQVFLRFVGER